MLKEPEFTVGIEEEYLLVDKTSRDLVSDPSPDLFELCKEKLHDQVSPEFMKSQIEVGTGINHTVDDAGAELQQLRATVIEVAAQFNSAPIAASTHPFALWTEQSNTDRERYNELAEDMQTAARRLLICGMHVHVGIEGDDLRIDLMNQARYFLPHILALSTSSPFWQGRETGMMSYRLSVFDELPRTGLPTQFTSYSEYERTAQVLINAGILEDTTKIWWDLRPSARFPTLEMRISDVCPLLEDTIAIAALYRCILRMLFRLRRQNQRWRTYPLFLLAENRWRARRYGMTNGLIDFGRGEVVDFGELLDELIELMTPDAEFFGCMQHLQHLKTMYQRGTSATRQIDVFDKALKAGASHDEALKQVVDLLIDESARPLNSSKSPEPAAAT